MLPHLMDSLSTLESCLTPSVFEYHPGTDQSLFYSAYLSGRFGMALDKEGYFFASTFQGEQHFSPARKPVAWSSQQAERTPSHLAYIAVRDNAVLPFAVHFNGEAKRQYQDQWWRETWMSRVQWERSHKYWQEPFIHGYDSYGHYTFSSTYSVVCSSCEAELVQQPFFEPLHPQ